jgi:hypothetical protein
MEAKLIKTIDGYQLNVIGHQLEKLGQAVYPHTITKQKLSLKNCQEIELGYDLDELADNYSDVFDAFTDDRFDAFKAGFQKALEILGDKKFKDMMKLCDVVYQFSMEADNNFLGTETRKELIDKATQQTEWEVEIDMEFKPINHASGLEFTGHKLMDFAISQNYQPLLDPNGCLILKRK